MRRAVFAVVALAFGTSAAYAAPLVPSFDNAPSGWTVDRYTPHAFLDIGSFQGRDDVLQIEIHRDEGAGARPSGQQGMFYNTQGRKHEIAGGIGDWIAADLWIDESWDDPDDLVVRTDIWGRRGLDGNESGVEYPILGFTNLDGARFRAWDADTANGWVDLAVQVNYGAWNSLAIHFTGTEYLYFVNGALAYTDSTVSAASTLFTDVFLQAYNFFDPSLFGGSLPQGVNNYSVHWANEVSQQPVPEPATLALLSGGLVGLAAKARRRRRN